MLNKFKHPLLYAILAFVTACSSGNDEEKTIASTHPELEQQLARDSVRSPVHDANSEDLYQRYRITMEEYEHDGSYAVESIYQGELPQLDEGSHPDVGTYRSSLRDGLRDGINFAGKYTVVSVGCGTTCQQHFIVNRETGKITESIQSSMGAKFSPNSRILIINPPDANTDYQSCNNCTPEAYVMENNKLRKLSYEDEIHD